MRKDFEQERKSKGVDFAGQAMRMKILDPKVDLGLDEAVWQGMRDELEACRKNGGWGFFCSLVMDMKILAASRADMTVVVIQTDAQKHRLLFGLGDSQCHLADSPLVTAGRLATGEFRHDPPMAERLTIQEPIISIAHPQWQYPLSTGESPRRQAGK